MQDLQEDFILSLLLVTFSFVLVPPLKMLLLILMNTKLIPTEMKSSPHGKTNNNKSNHFKIIINNYYRASALISIGANVIVISIAQIWVRDWRDWHHGIVPFFILSSLPLVLIIIVVRNGSGPISVNIISSDSEDNDWRIKT